MTATDKLWQACQEENMIGQGTNIMCKYMNATTYARQFDAVGMFTLTTLGTYNEFRAFFTRDASVMDATIYNSLVNNVPTMELQQREANVMKGFTTKSSQGLVVATSLFVAIQDGDRVFLKDATSPRQDDFVEYNVGDTFRYVVTTHNDALYILQYGGDDLVLTKHGSTMVKTWTYITKPTVSFRIGSLYVFDDSPWRIGFVESFVGTTVPLFRLPSDLNTMDQCRIQIYTGSGPITFPNQQSDLPGVDGMLAPLRVSEILKKSVVDYSIKRTAVRMIDAPYPYTMVCATNGSHILAIPYSNSRAVSIDMNKIDNVGCMSEPHLMASGVYDMVYSVKSTNKVYRVHYATGSITDGGNNPSFPSNNPRWYEVQTDPKDWTSFTFIGDVLYATTAEQFGTLASAVGHTIWRYDTNHFTRVAVLGQCNPSGPSVAFDGARQTMAFSNGRFYTFNRDSKRVYRWSDDLADLLSQELTYKRPPNATIKLYNSGEVVVMNGASIYFTSGTGVTENGHNETSVTLSANGTYVVSENGVYVLERQPKDVWKLSMRVLNTSEFAEYCQTDVSGNRLMAAVQRMRKSCSLFPNDPRCLCIDEPALMKAMGYDTFDPISQGELKTRVGCLSVDCVNARKSNPSDIFNVYMDTNYKCSGTITICNSNVNMSDSSAAAITIQNACGQSIPPTSTPTPPSMNTNMIIGIVIGVLVVGAIVYVGMKQYYKKPMISVPLRS